MIILLLTIIIVVLAFFLIKGNADLSDKSFTDKTTEEQAKTTTEGKTDNAFDIDSMIEYYSDSGNLQFGAMAALRNRMGKCQRNSLPAHIKVKVLLKGKKLRIREFLCNGLEYISSRCFDQKTDSIAMQNYVPYNSQQGNLPFSISFHSLGVTNNEFEFSIAVFDSNNKLIGKYPQTGTEKVIKDKIKLLSETVSYRDFITITL